MGPSTSYCLPLVILADSGSTALSSLYCHLKLLQAVSVSVVSIVGTELKSAYGPYLKALYFFQVPALTEIFNKPYLSQLQLLLTDALCLRMTRFGALCAY